MPEFPGGLLLCHYKGHTGDNPLPKDNFKKRAYEIQRGYDYLCIECKRKYQAERRNKKLNDPFRFV